ncbi:hypothetical protein U9M48_024781, partial [Paspalum notatum var. saurae]
LKRETGVFFDAAHLRRMLLHDRWAAASCYALRFPTVGDCSSAGDMLRCRLVVFRVIANYAACRRTCAVNALFQGLYDSLHGHPKCHPHRRMLLSLRSEHSKWCQVSLVVRIVCSGKLELLVSGDKLGNDDTLLHRSTKSKVVEDIMYLVARCPELKAKAQLPHCSFNSKYIVSLGYWDVRCVTGINLATLRHMSSSVRFFERGIF